MASDHQRNVGPMQNAPRCGAKTRSGTPCQSPSIQGSARCRMHGGRGSGAPLGNHNALKHGAYDREMRERTATARHLLREARRLKKLIGLKGAS